ncbi:MAG: acetate--CoA ligase family protein [Candidatus Helarchaeota archaeon]
MTSKVVRDIESIMNSRSVAFFGVSARSGKLGNLLLQGFIDLKFNGNLYPINPNSEEIMGLKAYKNIKDIDGEVDLAIISLHPKKVLLVVKECIEKRVKGIVIFSSGFREKSSEGKELENQLLDLIKNTNTRIIGPNCMGIYSPSTKLSFFPGLSDISGPVGFLSQSGSIANILTYLGILNGIGFSRIVSYGNGLDLNFNDFLEYLGEDPETKIICGYVEGMEDGQRLITLAKRISQKKPIIIWKVGETKSGAMAAKSHTGSLCGSKEIWEGIYKQTGIIKVDNFQDLLGNILAFINPYLPKGNKVAIISGPGGPAVSTADACEKAGLELAELSEDTKKQISEILPEFGTSVKNPIDLSLQIAFDQNLNDKAVGIVGKDQNVDLIVLFIGTLQKNIVRGLARAQSKIRKPIAVVQAVNSTSAASSGHMKNLYGPINQKRFPAFMQKMYNAGISLHTTEHQAAKVLMNLVKYSKFLRFSDKF